MTGIFLLTCLSLAPGAADQTAPPPPGAQVADVTLVDIHRRPRSLADYAEKKALAVVFIGTECPLANLYLPTLAALHQAYSPQGVQFLAVNANPQDTFIETAAHAQDREIPFPVLKDFDQRAAKALGATRTPEVVLLDQHRVIRYRGRIDDQHGVGTRRPQPSRQDLKQALDELLAGQAVSNPFAAPAGCLITHLPQTAPAGEVTFARDISRIFQARCQECHRPGQIGPMPLLSYEDAQGWADMIREVVLEERMPPWHADPRYGNFSNERRLSADEKALIRAWVEQGCPKGSEQDLPPPREFSQGWTIGEPDAVFEMAEEFAVPATGVLDYQRFTVDPGFKHDAWVQAAECRPGNRAVVHHILVYIQEPGKPIYGADGRASMLAGWAPGDMPGIYPPGTAKRLPAGSKLVFEVHYTPNGTRQADRSRVGVRFAAEPPAHVVETNILANLGLRVPPGAACHREEFNFTFRRDALLISFMPHMHLRGTSAKYVATYPDGRSETLLSVPDWDFNWQSVYRFAEPPRVPRGTKLSWVATWDNSADNPRNPDPQAEVRWGLQTSDEMQNGWMELVWLNSQPLDPAPHEE